MYTCKGIFTKLNLISFNYKLHEAINLFGDPIQLHTYAYIIVRTAGLGSMRKWAWQLKLLLHTSPTTSIFLCYNYTRGQCSNTVNKLAIHWRAGVSLWIMWHKTNGKLPSHTDNQQLTPFATDQRYRKLSRPEFCERRRWCRS